MVKSSGSSDTQALFHDRQTLKGDRTGQHSIRVNEQWRICFRWSDGHAYEVEIVDYHS